MRTINRSKFVAALAASSALALPVQPAQAQASDPYLAQLMLFGGNFCPRGWASTSGQILAISTNTALFSLLGTTYGGNGQTTFALPDLRGRSALGMGQGPGLSQYDLGQLSGTETVTLTTNQMPAHLHTATTSANVPVSSQMQNTNVPNGGSLATFPAGNAVYFNGPGDQPGMNVNGSIAINPAGGSQPHNNLSPYLAMTWCIAVQGVFPSRN